MEIYWIVAKNIAILQQTVPQRQGTVLLVGLEQLLALRELVSQVPAEAAGDEDFERVESGAWAVSGSSFGIALMYEDAEHGALTLFLEAEEWRALAEALFIGDELLSQVEAAEVAGVAQPRVAEAIASGVLFAFKVPGLLRRQWLIPRRAVEKWRGRRLE